MARSDRRSRRASEPGVVPLRSAPAPLDPPSARRAAPETVVVALLVAVISFLAFLPALRAGFVNWDDDKNITGNYELRDQYGAKFVRWAFTTSKMGHYQPFSWLTLGLDHRLWGLSDPNFPEAWGYHLTNMLLHAATAVAVYLLALRLLPHALPLPAGGSERPAWELPVVAGLAALLFAVHPLRCESVAWVTERRDVLSGLFFVLAIWAYVGWAPPVAPAARWSAWHLAAVASGMATVGLVLVSIDTHEPRLALVRSVGGLGLVSAAVAYVLAIIASRVAVGPIVRVGWRGYVAATGFLLASLFSKAWGMVIPAVLLVLDVWPLRRWRRRTSPMPGQLSDEANAVRSAAQLVIEKVPFWVPSVIFAFLAAWAQTGQLDTAKTLEQWGVDPRIAQCFYGLAFYPFRTIWPAGLVPLYELPDPMNPFEPRFVAAAAAVLGLSTALVLMARRFPAGLAAWVTFTIIVSPVLGVLQSGPQLVAERYTYLSCIPFALLAAGVAWAILRRWNRAGVAVYPAAACVVAVLFVLTLRQTGIWRSSATLWGHTYAVNPKNATACLNLGIVRKNEALAARDPADRRRLLEEAIRLYDEAFALQENPRTLSNAGNALNNLSELSRGEERAALLDKAIDYHRRALALSEQKKLPLPEFRLNYGVALMARGQHELARPEIEAFVRQKPKHPRGRNNLGLVYLELKQPQRALPHLEEAVRLDPNYTKAWVNLARAYHECGDQARAAEACRRVLRLSPRDADARRLLNLLEPPS